MDSDAVRRNLRELVRSSGSSFAELSRLLGRNPAYIQQYVSRGHPAKLEAEDRSKLCRFFGVSESILGGTAEGSLVKVPRLDVQASAGSGRIVDGEVAVGAYHFDPKWLARLTCGKPGDLSIISVTGDSMAPTLGNGDDVLVDTGDRRIRDGVYVLRRDDDLIVKRLSVSPASGYLTVASDNPTYPTWTDVPPETIVVIGRVVWAGRVVN
jgi:phage repressor protein C with HTH and peptisase S24 domain